MGKLRMNEVAPCEDGVKRREPRTEWCTIYLTSVLAFLLSSNFTLYFASLWPYLEKIDDSATEVFFGYVMTTYYLGQCLSAPLLGFWSNRIRQTRLPVIVGVWLMFIGNLLYLCIELLPSNRRYLMLVGRFIGGFGSGSVSLLRAYAAMASTTADRSRAIAFVTGGSALGLACGPGFQLLFTRLTYPGMHIVGAFRLNMYTAPAYFACLLNIASFLIVIFRYVETYSGLATPSSKKSGCVQLPPYDKCAVGIAAATKFTQTFVTTTIDCIGAPLSMMMFGFTNEESVRYIALSRAILGVVSFLSYFSYILFKLHRFIRMRTGCIVSLVSFITVYLLTFSWWFLPTPIPTYSSAAGSNSSESRVGCNVDEFEWCDSTRQVNVWLYYGSQSILLGLSAPVFNIVLNTLLSRVVGPRRLGTIQGTFQATGSIAKVASPVLMSMLYMSSGPRLVWTVQLVVIMSNLFLWGVFYNRMVPLKFERIASVTTIVEHL